MRLSATREPHRRSILVHRSDGRGAPLAAIAPQLPDDQISLLARLADPEARAALQRDADELADGDLVELPTTGETDGTPAIDVDHVLGIGLNYRAHAADLGAPEPEEPAWFTKFARTIGGSGSTEFLPPDSRKVTAEAELVTLDELLRDGSLGHVEVTTSNSDGSSHRGPVSDMLFDPARVISELSAVVPLRPGDLIATGTPGATALNDGDRVTGEVSGVGRVLAVVSRPDGDRYRDEVLAALPHLDTRPA